MTSAAPLSVRAGVLSLLIFVIFALAWHMGTFPE